MLKATKSHLIKTPEKQSAIYVFCFLFEFADVIIYLFCSIIYMKAARIMYFMQKRMAVRSNSDRNKHRDIRNLHLAFRCFYISYTLLWLACLYRLLISGYYNMAGLIAYTMVAFLFMLLKTQVFVILARWPLDLRLRTQVLATGRVLLIAYDEYGREVLKVIMLMPE